MLSGALNNNDLCLYFKMSPFWSMELCLWHLIVRLCSRHSTYRKHNLWKFILSVLRKGLIIHRKFLLTPWNITGWYSRALKTQTIMPAHRGGRSGSAYKCIIFVCVQLNDAPRFHVLWMHYNMCNVLVWPVHLFCGQRRTCLFLSLYEYSRSCWLAGSRASWTKRAFVGVDD